ncbi:MAG: alpha/beta hydrolase [Pseudomonadota bacterium]
MITPIALGGAASAAALAAAVTRFHLLGEDLSKYDGADADKRFPSDPNSEGAQKVRAFLDEHFIKPAAAPGSREEKLRDKRRMFDENGLNREFDCAFRDATIQTEDGELTGEWTIPDDCTPEKRLLYIHGGANTVGSAVSHRPIITNLANRTRCAVFAPNYRLMPENARLDGVKDCRAAYEWVCENGPDGPAPAGALSIGGDSAGANLTLSLINWVRDEGKRTPQAVFAISPAVDTTFASPSLKGNLDTDLMLKPLATPLLKVPRPLMLWLSWRVNGVSPSDPAISPIFADLSGLPPTLIHISSAEILFDDARRYAAKRAACGSPARLHVWEHMAHVWHIFDRFLPESHQAFDDIADFMRENGAAAGPAQ